MELSSLSVIIRPSGDDFPNPIPIISVTENDVRSWSHDQIHPDICCLMFYIPDAPCMVNVGIYSIHGAYGYSIRSNVSDFLNSKWAIKSY